MAAQLFTYRAKVRRVVDGDTLDLLIVKPITLLDVDLGFGFLIELTLTWKHKIRVRLAAVNAWEKTGRERRKGLKAWHRVEELCPVDSEVDIETHKTGKFNRYVAVVTLSDGRDLGSVLLEEGHARPYE